MTVACTPSLFNICRKNAYQVRLLSYDLMDHLIVDYQERLDYHPPPEIEEYSSGAGRASCYNIPKI